MDKLQRDELVTELRTLRPVLERAGVLHMALFGSRARQDHRGDSDVDLVVDIDDARKFSMLDLVGVGHTIGDHLRLEPNILLRRSLQPDFAAEIGRDLIEVF